MNILSKHALFLRWYLFFSLICISSVFCHYLGGFEEIYLKDSSKLSFLILGIFYFMSIWCGIKTYALSKILKQKDKDTEEIQEIERLSEIGWFCSEFLLTLGMIGTVLGFILMLGEFGKVDAGNVGSIQKLLSGMSFGMSMALFTTIVGLVCGSLLKIQYFNLAQSLDLIKNLKPSLILDEITISNEDIENLLK